ncbi:MAG: hypothetical protein QGH70_09465 [Nitrospinota bacterium]|nr:hypothetical protein [Nitrospinota bacterium]MDP6484059.1 hypothetical protein [Nitrospinota bacterium]MDP7384938.1 hypothetical protein [Nitrospinota bacterium]HJM42490.1 hypothetical protein [Nitrospinota bacterium]
MDEFKAQITATAPTVTRPGSAAAFTAAAPPGEQLLLDLPAPNPPPKVEKIRDAADPSYGENRPLLAVLSAPRPEEIRAIDLQA